MISDITKQALLSRLHNTEGWLSDKEGLLLYALAKDCPATGEIVEIGSYKGKSTIALGYGLRVANKSGSIWTVDPHDGIISTRDKKIKSTFEQFQKNIKNAGLEQYIHPLVTTSKKAATSWGKPIRLLFIDGLHDSDHAKEDYQLWSSWVTTHGIIAFHDGFCGEQGVWSVISEQVFKRKDIVDIGTVTSILYVVLGKPTRFSSVRVRCKKKVIRMANWIHNKPFSWKIKKIIIHIGLRLLLVTRYTWGVYKR